MEVGLEGEGGSGAGGEVHSTIVELLGDSCSELGSRLRVAANAGDIGDLTMLLDRGADPNQVRATSNPQPKNQTS